MTKTNLSLVLIIAFLFGCVTAKIVIPDLRAGQENLTKWEVFCVSKKIFFLTDQSAKVSKELTEIGIKGWEPFGQSTVSPQNNILEFCFKRPLN